MGADDSNQRPLVLVTGATGFVGTHCVREALARGYRVRGTVRDAANLAKVGAILRLPYAEKRLELFEIDLHDGGEKWLRALTDVSYVLHVASPVPVEPDESTIRTAIQGTTAVLEAAALSPTVRKVVMTSSCTAVNDGHSVIGRVFDERDWTELSSPKVDAYARSKTLAEREAWKLWRSLDPANRFDLTVVNPTLIIGPLLSDADSGSAMIVRRMLSFTTFLAAPPAYIGVVDVRDVAWAHVQALTTPATNGQRILLTNSPTIRFRTMTRWLQEEFGPLGYPISFVEAPLWLLKLYAKAGIDKQAKATVHRCEGVLSFDNGKSIKLLGMRYRDPRESLYTQVYSMLELGMVTRTGKYKRKVGPKQIRVVGE